MTSADWSKAAALLNGAVVAGAHASLRNRERFLLHWGWAGAYIALRQVVDELAHAPSEIGGAEACRRVLAYQVLMSDLAQVPDPAIVQREPLDSRFQYVRRGSVVADLRREIALGPERLGELRACLARVGALDDRYDEMITAAIARLAEAEAALAEDAP